MFLLLRTTDFAAVMTWIVVFWNTILVYSFRNNLKMEAAVSSKFWLIFPGQEHHIPKDSKL